MAIPRDKSNAFLDGPEYPIWHNTDSNRLSARAFEYSDLRERYLQYLLDAAGSSVVVENPSVLIEKGLNRPSWLPDAGWMEMEVAREYDQIQEALYQDTLARIQSRSSSRKSRSCAPSPARGWRMSRAR